MNLPSVPQAPVLAGEATTVADVASVIAELRWRRDQFFQLRYDREAGPLACRVRCCVSASMFVVGPFRGRQCEQLVLRSRRVLRHQLQFSVTGGEDQVVNARSNQVRG